MSEFKLRRDQIAQFVKDPAVIKALENIFRQVTVTTPEETSEIAQIVGSGRRENQSDSLRRIDEIEQTPQVRRSDFDALARSVESLEQSVQSRKSDLDSIRRSIESMEQLINARQTNLDSIRKRLESIEAFLGV